MLREPWSDIGRLQNEVRDLNYKLNQCAQSHEIHQTNRVVGRNNTSGITGVVWAKTKDKWQAQIMVNRKNIFLGRYVELKDAVLSRYSGELKYFQNKKETSAYKFLKKEALI